MPSLFISYHHEEARRAQSLAAGLKARQLSTVMDVSTLRAGDPLRPEIDSRIGASGAMVALWSHRGPNDRRWVEHEIEHAVGLGVRVVRVVLPGAAPPAYSDELDAPIDVSATWTDPDAVPANLVDALERAARPRVFVLRTGLDAEPLLHAIAATPPWSRWILDEMGDPGPDFRNSASRVVHAAWQASARPAQRSERFVVFAATSKDNHAECCGYISAIRWLAWRRLRFKASIALLVDNGDNPWPSAMRHYNRISSACTPADLIRLWRSIEREWDDKPRSSLGAAEEAAAIDALRSIGWNPEVQ